MACIVCGETEHGAAAPTTSTTVGVPAPTAAATTADTATLAECSGPGDGSKPLTAYDHAYPLVMACVRHPAASAWGSRAIHPKEVRLIWIFPTNLRNTLQTGGVEGARLIGQGTDMIVPHMSTASRVRNFPAALALLRTILTVCVPWSRSPVLQSTNL